MINFPSSPFSASFPKTPVAPAQPAAPSTRPDEVEAVAVTVADERQDADTTASNILDFVANGIASLQQQGASDERLQARLDAARSGVEKGYQQATDMLSAMGLLDDSLKQDIAASRSLVDAGLKDLASLGQRNSGWSGAGLVAESSLAASDHRVAMEVMTRDGDRVTLRFQQWAGYSAASGGGRQTFSALQGQQFQLEIDGQLDDGERKALNSLFEQAGSLAQQFFGGDLGKALEQAMSLDFDADKLASFSLDLRQNLFASKSRYYQPAPVEWPTPQLQDQKSQLLNYLDSYLSAVERLGLDEVSSTAAMLGDMVEQLVGAEQPQLDSMKAFNQGLLSGRYGSQ